MRLEPHPLGDVGRRGLYERLTVGEEDDGELIALERRCLEQSLRVLAFDIEPAVRHLVVREQVANLL